MQTSRYSKRIEVNSIEHSIYVLGCNKVVVRTTEVGDKHDIFIKRRMFFIDQDVIPNIPKWSHSTNGFCGSISG